MKRQGTRPGVAACLAKWMVVLLGWWAMVSTGTAITYYLPPSVETAGLDLVSLRDGNQVQVGVRQFDMDSGEQRRLTAADLSAAGLLTAERALALTGTAAGTDLIPTDHYLGTEYVVPQGRGRHQYAVFSPYLDTVLQIRQGDDSYSRALQAGQWTNITSDDNTQPLQLRTAVPIVVFHRTLHGKDHAQDAFAVPPAAHTLWGIAGASTLVAALQNNTHLTVTNSEGDSARFTLQAGEQIRLPPAATAQGWGQALQLNADKPIMAVSLSDGQGADAQAFWPYHLLAADYRLPRNARQLHIACPESATQLRWQDANGQEQMRPCGTGKGIPGRQTLNGDIVSVGFRLRADHPVLVWVDDRDIPNTYHLAGYVERQFVLEAGSEPAHIYSQQASRIHTATNHQAVSAGSTAALALDRYPAPVWAGDDFILSSGGAAVPAIREDSLSTRFSLPQRAGEHHYWLYSPHGLGKVQVSWEDNLRTLLLPPGMPVTVAVASRSDTAVHVQADRPIAVWHKGREARGVTEHAYVATGVETELWGVQSQSVAIGAVQDDTQVQVFGSDGSQTDLALSAGDYTRLDGGRDAAQGHGPALYLKSNRPIAAVQLDDGDGAGATAFWGEARLANHFHLLQAVDYAVVVCPTTSRITVHYPNSDPYSEDCSAQGEHPGKLRLPMTSDGSIPASTQLLASRPVYVMVDPLDTQREYPLYGFKTRTAVTAIDEVEDTTAERFSVHSASLMMLASVSAPTITTAPGATTANPFTVAGTATATTDIRLYVNGVLQRTVASDSSGNFTVPAALLDGANTLHVTEWDGTDESVASNSISVTYSNTLSKTQGGTLAASAVWTQGDGTPYQITTNLMVPIGVELTLMPGTRLQFASGRNLTVQGTLTLLGQSSAKVVLTSTAANPAASQWVGVMVDGATAQLNLSHFEVSGASTGISVVNNARATISHANVHHNWYGFRFETGGQGTVSTSQIYSNTEQGIYLLHANSYVILTGSELFDNQYGVTFSTSTSGLLEGNVIRNNSLYGVYVLNQATPVIRNGNEIRNNNSGVFVNVIGAIAVANNPTPVVTGNRIHSNTNYNYYANRFAQPAAVKLNATGNYWGSTDPSVIALKIYDYTDDTGSSPVVDFSGFVDAEGDVVPGEQLSGMITADTTLTANTEYWILSSLIVDQGRTLTIPAGATLRHVAGSRLTVWGTLNINGTAAEPVVLSSTSATAAANQWVGIAAGGATAQLNLSHVEVSGASTGISVVNNARATISHANVHHNWYGFRFETGGQGTVSTSQIYSNTEQGIYLLHANSYVTLTGSELFDNQYGVTFSTSSSGLLEGNVIRNNSLYGVYVLNQATPVIRNGNEIRNNSSGVFVNVIGAIAVANNPAPVVTGNRIHSNTNYNYYANRFAQPAAVKLIATGNYWGSTDPSVIALKIYDYTDNAGSSPVVDYSGFVDAEGDVVPGEQLSGMITADTTLTANTEYWILSSLIVDQGRTLTIPAGVRFRQAAGSQLLVLGTLNINGTASDPVVLTSTAVLPAAYGWHGLVVSGTGAQLNLNHVEVSGATTGISVVNNARATISHANVHHNWYGFRFETGGQGTVSTSQIYSNTEQGIYLLHANSYVTLTGSELFDNQYGVTFSTSTSGLLEGNVIRNNSLYGVYILNQATPVIRNGNEIRNNNSGVFVYVIGAIAVANNPTPVVTGNRIHSNTNYNYYANRFAQPATVKLNATGNYWGSTDPSVIALKIYDYTDNAGSSPVVDYSGFVDAEGNVIPGESLLGTISANQQLLPDTLYWVLSPVTVNADVTLTIPSGTQLKFINGAVLQVMGNLIVSGTASSPVAFTSASTAPTRGGWTGINVTAGGTGRTVNISNARIEWADVGIKTTGVNLTLSAVELTRFKTAGIHMTNAGGLIDDVWVDNGDKVGALANHTGIYLNNSSPTIQNSIIQNSHFGLHLVGASNPLIQGNVIAYNNYGLYLQGSGNDASNPNPVITGNDIINNSTRAVYFNNYGANSSRIIDLTNNWWGSATPNFSSLIQYGSTPAAAANTANHRETPSQTAVSSALTRSNGYFSPNTDGTQDSVQINATLSASESWALSILNSAGTVVRTYSGSGAAVAADWDGRNDSGALQGDGLYRFRLTTTADNRTKGWQQAILDVTAPTAQVLSPAASSIFQDGSNVVIHGTAVDNNLQTYSVQWGSGSSPSSYQPLATGSANVQNVQLALWQVNDPGGAAGMASGDYTIRLLVADKAGNQSQVLVPVTLDLLKLLNVSKSSAVIQPLQNESVTINYTLSGAADVVLSIYADGGTTPLRQINQNQSAAGTFAFSWNGRDTANQWLPEGAYRFELEALASGRRGVYAPVVTPGTVTGSGTIDTQYNPHTNDYWQGTYTLSQPAKLTLTVNTGSEIFDVFRNKVFEAGVHPILWDGRNPQGTVLTGAGGSALTFSQPRALAPNEIFVKGTEVKLGSAHSTRIEILSDPYMVVHSYEQISNIRYRIDQDAYVSFTLLPPGITDPADPKAFRLLNDLLQTGSSAPQPTVEWKGYDTDDTNAILIDSEGTYTYLIEARSVATGFTSRYRGSLVMYQ